MMPLFSRSGLAQAPANGHRRCYNAGGLYDVREEDCEFRPRGLLTVVIGPGGNLHHVQ